MGNTSISSAWRLAATKQDLFPDPASEQQQLATRRVDGLIGERRRDFRDELVELVVSSGQGLKRPVGNDELLRSGFTKLANLMNHRLD